jgi:hypothetical protein
MVSLIIILKPQNGIANSSGLTNVEKCEECRCKPCTRYTHVVIERKKEELRSLLKERRTGVNEVSVYSRFQEDIH